MTFSLCQSDRTSWECCGSCTPLGSTVVGFRVPLGYGPVAAPGGELAEGRPGAPYQEMQAQVSVYSTCSPLTRLGQTASQSPSQVQAAQSGPSRPRSGWKGGEPFLPVPLRPAAHSVGAIEHHVGNLIGSVARQGKADQQETEHHPPRMVDGGDRLSMGRAMGRGQWEMHTGCGLAETLVRAGSWKAIYFRLWLAAPPPYPAAPLADKSDGHLLR